MYDVRSKWVLINQNVNVSEFKLIANTKILIFNVSVCN